MKMINSTNPTRVSATLVMISVALVAAIAALSAAQVPRSGYTYSKIATLGVGGVSGDFEVGGLNNAGDAVFVSETSQCVDSYFGPNTFCETAFLYRAGHVSEILPPSSPGTSGTPLPGGGTFANQSVGPTALNNSGEAAVALFQVPPQLPFFGTNAGLYRYSGGSLRAVVIPGVTKVPGSLATRHFRASGKARTLIMPGTSPLLGSSRVPPGFLEQYSAKAFLQPTRRESLAR